MDTRSIPIIEQAVKTIQGTYYRVLIRDTYEEYELKALEKALRKLLAEVEGK